MKNYKYKKKIFQNKNKFKESKLLKLNSSKSYLKLKWKNTWGMKRSIKETARWYKNYLIDRKLQRAITSKQIKQYFYD